MRHTLVVGLLLLLMVCPIVSSEENNDAQSENTTEWIGPEFIFTCEDRISSQGQQWNSGRYYDLNEVRPDLPSGEIVKPIECYLYNPNDFNITIELSVPSGIDIWSPDEFCEDRLGYGYDPQTGMWGYVTETYCRQGQWIIENSNYRNQNQSFVLTKNESLYPNLTIYADSLVDPMQPGWQEINLTTRIIKTQWLGDNETLCLNCSSINYTSTQFFNQWWNIDAYINLGRCTANYNSEYPVSLVPSYMFEGIWNVCDDVEMSNKVEQIRYNDYFMDVYCTSERKYTDIDWRFNSQYTTHCEFEIDTNWQKLFNSNELEQAKMLEPGEFWGEADWEGGDYFANYVDTYNDEDLDYWGNNVCPEEIPVMVSFFMGGNSNFTKSGEIQLISHMYNLDNGSTIQEIGNQTFEISSYNTTYLPNEFSLSPPEEENLLIVLESRFFLENESYVSYVLGSCLTRSAATSLNEIFEKSEVTMGIAGGPLQQFSNSIAYAIGVDSFVVIGFFSMCIPPILYFVLTRTIKQRNDDF